MDNKKVSIEITANSYILKGNIDALLGNRRFCLSLKRLGYQGDRENGTITIPFEEPTKIAKLQEIRDLFSRFGFHDELADSTKKQLVAYDRELENFAIFSNQAKKIRNDEFSDNPDLVGGFKSFLEVLSQRMVARELYDLQKLSAFHMAFSQNACNFAVPGAGKTSIVYGAYAYLKNLPADSPKHVDKLLVIGPLSSFAPWENEYEQCFGHRVESRRLSGDQTQTKDTKIKHLYSDSPKELTLISHAGIGDLEHEITDFLKRYKTMVVVDEAHRIKNSEGVWGQSAVEIAKEATARIILTGTPVPNGYEDLYNLFQFLYPFKFQDILKIHYEQLKGLTKNMVSENDSRVKSFVENIKPYFIRIKKRDLKLPGVEESVIRVPMDEHQREIYSFIEDKYIESFRNNASATIKDALNKARLIRLRQAATNPSLLLNSLQSSLEQSEHGEDPNFRFARLYDESIEDSRIFRQIRTYSGTAFPQKFLRIKELLISEIFPSGGKAVVWTVFIQNAEDLQEYLKKEGIATRLLIGRVPQDERERIVEEFNNPENLDFQVVIANPFSVAESISMHQGCHNAIYMERDYNAANFLQSKDRIHRVGLSEDVVTSYFYLISEDSVDSIIQEKLAKKVSRMEAIIDEDIPLFNRLDDLDETDVITALLENYARRA